MATADLSRPPAATSNGRDARPLRFWPAVAIVAVIGAAMTAIGFTVRDPDDPWFFIPVVFAGPGVIVLLLAVWWVGFSRLSGRVKVTGLALAVGLTLGVGFTGHASLRPMVWMWPIQTAAVGCVLVWLISFPLPNALRVIAVLAMVAASTGFWSGVRMDGSTGPGKPILHARWTPTDEERFLAQRGDIETSAVAEEPLTAGPEDWVAFRGADRQGHGPDINLDAGSWASQPPEQLWKHGVGPGWSSFTVVDGYAFTQVQLGPDEATVAYDVDTGGRIWEYKRPARFEEAFGGPGPRGTPTFHDGRLYVMGATGWLECLDARTGDGIWSVDVAEKFGSPTPMWAFSASPLVWGDTVMVPAGGEGNSLLVAFRTEDGSEAWRSDETGPLGHSSPQLATLGGVEQVLLFAGPGLFSFDPKFGETLWRFEWPTLNPEYKISQPQIVGDDSLIVGIGYAYGTKRLRITKQNDGWEVTELWHSKRMKPKFNDYVWHDGHVYGFNGSRLVCLDGETGEEMWTGDSYGYGQLLLVGDELLILSDEGVVASVAADPEEFNELGRFRAIEGKTWAHPVIADGKLLVRNGREAACFRLGR